MKIEKERLEKQEQERKMQEELERRQADQLKEKQRLEDERETKQSGLNNMQEESLVRRSKPHLNYFESEDWPQESKSPHSPSPNTSGPTENLMDVVYDDFSVKQNLINIEFDDFSVKPIKVISRRKTESSPVFRSWDDFLDIEEVKGLVPVDVKTERAKEDEMEKPEQCPNTPPLQEREWVEEIKDEPEEEQLISLNMKKEEKLISVDVKKEEQLISLDVEEEEEEKETETEDEDEMEEDNQEDQTNSFSTKNEDKDTDALIDFGLNHDQQDPVWEQTPERNSPQPVPDEVPEVSSEDTADDLKEPEFAPFPESSTPLLDTSAQRSKADLGKRRIRTRPSRRLTAGLAQTETQDWGTQDSTVEKETVAKERESDSEEEQPKPKVVCSPSQRVPVFPGMSPAGLLAQLKRKTGGGGTAVKEETVESKASEEKEHQDEEVAPSSVELSHSPRTPARLAGATRVLPLIGNKEEGGASSPAWLKELKSKKRMSQHGSDA
ncbi:uncharacterized protein KIAA1671-like [Pundamilia nyererei]|uniref:Uncharacterized protein KIAA1671-like n=1 Tax=Pundamilia nyererei TaxID=303518 RepID=A0A9Y3VEN6_9CICH|nr:PREDICTED: uncharacterized protein KIAA1671-like [Pundamilia nyererei]